MSKRSTRKRRRWLVFGGIGLVLVALTLAAVFNPKEKVVEVETEKVTRRDLVETVVANGRIFPVVEVKISAEVSGEIIELPVREGQRVEKGDLLVRIKPDVYEANLKSAQASYESALANLANAQAGLRRAELEFQRNQQLFENHLIAELDFLAVKTSYEIAQAQKEIAEHNVQSARAALDRAREELSRTIIRAPISGTISRLNSEPGEKVVGTAMMTGTEIMTIADLEQMEARVDIGETDVVLVRVGQKARLEVDAFRDRTFHGTVTQIANSARSGLAAGQSQEAVKFEVRIRIQEKEAFRPGMSVTAEIETRYRTNVLAVPIQSVTTRPPKPGLEPPAVPEDGAETKETTNRIAGAESHPPSKTGERPASEAEARSSPRGSGETAAKPIEVVFVVDGDRVRMVPVRRGISDDRYTEIVAGLEEGQEVVSGGYLVISRDLEDGVRIRRRPAGSGWRKPAAGKGATPES